MRGGHDLGGRQGFGPVAPEPEFEEPVFHHEWERRVFAMTLATGMLGQWNIDQSRHARERQHPVAYLEQSYYENWLAGTEKLLLEAGLISQGELAEAAAGTAKSAAEMAETVAGAARAVEADSGRKPVLDAKGRRQQSALRVPDATAARKILTSGGPAVREIENPPRFAVGSKIIVERRHNPGHTRVPDYVQGCSGLVRDHHGAHIFPDANSAGNPVAHHLYSVEFSSRELWGSDAKPFDVLIDLWEPHLALAGGDGE